jgi:hypothetical protein
MSRAGPGSAMSSQVPQFYTVVEKFILHQCFPKVFVRRPLLASKNNHGSSNLCAHVYIMCPDDGQTKLKVYFSELT